MFEPRTAHRASRAPDAEDNDSTVTEVLCRRLSRTSCGVKDADDEENDSDPQPAARHERRQHHRNDNAGNEDDRERQLRGRRAHRGYDSPVG